MPISTLLVMHKLFIEAKTYTSHNPFYNPFTPRVSSGDINVVLTCESVDEILWCYHTNETSSAVLSHGTIYTLVFYKMKFGICLEF